MRDKELADVFICFSEFIGRMAERPNNLKVEWTNQLVFDPNS